MDPIGTACDVVPLVASDLGPSCECKVNQFDAKFKKITQGLVIFKFSSEVFFPSYMIR